MYLESMLGKMAKDIPGLVERMEAAASAATEDMVGSPLETSVGDPDPEPDPDPADPPVLHR
jgi:hypothetical protein